MKKSGMGTWKAFDFGPEETTRKSPIKKPKNNTHFKDSASYIRNTLLEKTSFNFTSNLIPKSVDDLAVHQKKILEVEEWLRLNINKSAEKYSSFLLISGPTGSGKTATLNVLCKKLGILISEWVNPLDQDYELFRGPNQVNRFSEFLIESKWTSLFEAGYFKRVTVVKDFPNAVIHQPEEFFNILEECYYKTKYPIIFISTDASSSAINLSRMLFPEEILNKYNITHISFNACAPSLMKHALKRAQALVQENFDLFKQPSSATIDAILATSNGDIRNAINQFYFASLLGTGDLPTIPNKITKVGIKRKRLDKNDKTSVLLSMSRDENLGLFHGLGRVLNPKRRDVGTSWRLNCDIDKLVDEFSTQPAMFVSFLFENYLKYFGDINDASRAVELLSLSLKFLDNWTDRHETVMFGLWLSVLGLMVYNEHKISKWNQICGPKKISKCVTSELKGAEFHSTDFFYYNLINGSDRFHKFNDV